MWLNQLIRNCRKVFGEHFISDAFIDIMKRKLQQDFYDQTGIDLSKTVNEIFLTDGSQASYINWGHESTLRVRLSFFQGKAFSIWIKWYDKKKFKIPRPFHREFDEKNLVMWIEDLDVKGILMEYNKKSKVNLGFDLSDIPYPVLVEPFSADGMYLDIDITEPDKMMVESLDNNLVDFINNWNEESEALDRGKGVIHNSSCEKMTDDRLLFYMDFGSASESALKGMLELIGKTNKIKKVSITSTPNI